MTEKKNNNGIDSNAVDDGLFGSNDEDIVSPLHFSGSHLNNTSNNNNNNSSGSYLHSSGSYLSGGHGSGNTDYSEISEMSSVTANTGQHQQQQKKKKKKDPRENSSSSSSYRNKEKRHVSMESVTELVVFDPHNSASGSLDAARVGVRRPLRTTTSKRKVKGVNSSKKSLLASGEKTPIQIAKEAEMLSSSGGESVVSSATTTTTTSAKSRRKRAPKKVGSSRKMDFGGDKSVNESSQQEEEEEVELDEDDKSFMKSVLRPDARRFTSLHKLCRAPTEGPSDEKWNDVRRFLELERLPNLKPSCETVQFGGITPLHLTCRKRPPLDVVETLLTISPATANFETSSGMIPLHNACEHSAPIEVVRVLLEVGGEDTCVRQDSHGKTPLHYALKNNKTSADVIIFLLDIGGTESLTTEDKAGRIPMEHVITYFAGSGDLPPNERLARKELLTGHILSCLYWIDPTTSMDKKSQRLNLNQGSRAKSQRSMSARSLPGLNQQRSQQPAEMARINRTASQNDADLLGLHNDDDDDPNNDDDDSLTIPGMRHKNNELFTLLKELSFWLQDHSITHIRSRDMIHDRFIRRAPTIFFVIDSYARLALAIGFTMASTEKLDMLLDPDEQADRVPSATIEGGFAITIMAGGGGWMLSRHALRVMSIKYPHYVKEIWNWLDLFTVLCTLAALAIMERTGNGFSARDRTVLAATGALVWISLLNWSRLAFGNLGVFVSVVGQMITSIFPIVITLAFIITAFVHTYYISYINTSFCLDSSNQDKFYCETKSPFLFMHSILYSYTLEGGPPAEIDKDDIQGTVFAFFFAFLISIILLNLIIARMINVYPKAMARGYESLAMSRFIYVMEVDHTLTSAAEKIPNIIKYLCCRLKCACCSWDIWKEESEDEDEETDNVRELFYGPEVWEKQPSFSFGGLLAATYRLCVPVGIFLWFLVGYVTFGLIWPKWMKQWLFGVNEDIRDYHGDTTPLLIQPSSSSSSSSSGIGTNKSLSSSSHPSADDDDDAEDKPVTLEEFRLMEDKLQQTHDLLADFIRLSRVKR